MRVSYGGRRAFVLRYRVNNRIRRLTLGPYPDLSLFEARRKAREVLGDVAHGDAGNRVTACAKNIHGRPW